LDFVESFDGKGRAVMTFDGFDAQMLVEPTMMGDLIQPEGEGEGGSGGPSTLETSIFTSMQPWDNVVWSDDTSMMTTEGFLYVDRDGNGWYDYVEWSEDNDTLWIWDTEDGWRPRNLSGD
jgi:hypothetical protein